MSFSLVKKSLELFEDNVQDIPRKKVTDKHKSNKASKKGIAKKKAKNNKSTRFKASSVIEECRKKQLEDKTDESLYLLQRLSSTSKPEPKSVELILEHTKGRLAKNNTVVDKKPEERTVFTDKDFDKFEEEYDFFS